MLEAAAADRQAALQRAAVLQELEQLIDALTPHGVGRRVSYLQRAWQLHDAVTWLTVADLATWTWELEAAEDALAIEVAERDTVARRAAPAGRHQSSSFDYSSDDEPEYCGADYENADQLAADGQNAAGWEECEPNEYEPEAAGWDECEPDEYEPDAASWDEEEPDEYEPEEEWPD